MKKFKSYKIISLLFTLMFFGGIKIVNAWPISLDDIKMSVGTTLLFLTSQVLRLAGIFFNCVMEYTINFSELVKNTGVVEIGWGIFRDLSNMVFIFILLIISISIILGLSTYGSKSLLTKVILVALLMNFSLFTTKVVIDAANVFTVGFYNATIKNANTIDGWDKGITSTFAGALNLNTIYKSTEMKPGSDYGGVKLGPNNILTVALMGSILLIVTAFVFFAASVLFMKRIVVLMFLMMLSPLAFLGMILPATKGYSSQWWNTLFKEAFYAPIFMMFIYVVATAIRSDSFVKNISSPISGQGFANVATGGGQMLVIFNFILIIGLMLASLITAAKMGATGASGMMSTGKKMQSWGQNKIKAGAGAATFGVGGRLSRATIGRGAEKIANSDWMKNKAEQGKSGSKLALKTLRNIGDSSFDVRNTEMGKKMGVGSGIKGGYKTKKEETKKAEIDYAKSLKGNVQDSGGYDIKDSSGNTTSRTEAYANKKANLSRTKTIMGTILKGAGTTSGQKQAAKTIMAETTEKKKLKDDAKT